MSVPKVLEKYIKPGTVFLISKGICPYCDLAKELLNDLQIKYDCIEYEAFKDRKELVETFHNHSGIKTYPKVYVGTQCIGGYSDLDKLYQSMKLFKILDREGIAYAKF
jgi:glutaredoxin 3